MLHSAIRARPGVVIGILLAVSSLCLAGPPAPQRSLLAISKADHKLVVVDLATLAIVNRFDVGADPHEVVATPDGKSAYVSNMDNTSGHEIDVIDLVGQRALPAIDTDPFRGPHGLAFLDGKLWFTAQGSKVIARYDPKSGRIDWVMGTGQDWTHMLAITPDGHRLYATNVASGTVSIFDYKLVPPSSFAFGFVPPGRSPTLEWVQTLIATGPGAEGFDVSPNGAELWTASPVTGQLFIVDTAIRIVTAYPAELFGANRLRFTRDGRRAFVSSIRSGDVFVLDADTRKLVKRMNFCHSATGIAMDPDGTRAFVACSSDSYLAVIDLASLEVTGRVDVGGKPDGLSFASRQ
jgi:YVTN family beta-propeller protein